MFLFVGKYLPFSKYVTHYDTFKILRVSFSYRIKNGDYFFTKCLRWGAFFLGGLFEKSPQPLKNFLNIFYSSSTSIKPPTLRSRIERDKEKSREPDGSLLM